MPPVSTEGEERKNLLNDLNTIFLIKKKKHLLLGKLSSPLQLGRAACKHRGRGEEKILLKFESSLQLCNLGVSPVSTKGQERKNLLNDLNTIFLIKKKKICFFESSLHLCNLGVPPVSTEGEERKNLLNDLHTICLIKKKKKICFFESSLHLCNLGVPPVSTEGEERKNLLNDLNTIFLIKKKKHLLLGKLSSPLQLGRAACKHRGRGEKKPAE